MSDPSAPDSGEDPDPGEDRDPSEDPDPSEDRDSGEDRHSGESGFEDTLETGGDDHDEAVEGTDTRSDEEPDAISTNGRDGPVGAAHDPPLGGEGDREADRRGEGSPDEPSGDRRGGVREMDATTDDGATADTSREVRHANPDPHPGDHTPEDEPDAEPAGQEPKRGGYGRDPDDHEPRGPDAGGTTDRTGTDTLKWLSGVVALVGAWIAASPFVYGAGAAALWNNVAVGVAILLVAGYNFYRTTGGLAPNVGGSSLVALLGVWSVVAPMLLPYASEPLAWSTMASGAAVAVLSGYHAYETRRTGAAAAPGTRA